MITSTNETRGNNNMNTVNTFKVSIPFKPAVTTYSIGEANKVIDDYRAKYDGGKFQTLVELANEAIIETVACGYVTRIGYSDRYPFEIVKIVSDKTIEVREMDAKLINGDDLNFQIGGFAAHCSNQHSQEYAYSSNEKNPIIRIRLCRDGYWKHKGEKFLLSEKPYKFYDYNF